MESAELYRGPVTLSPELIAVIRDTGRLVKSAMNSAKKIRTAVISPLYLGSQKEQRGQLILLADFRANLDTLLMAEIIDTSTDIRVHLFRRCSPLPETRDVPVLGLSAPPKRAPIMPPLFAPTPPTWRAEDILSAAYCE